MTDKEFIESNSIELCRIYIKTSDTKYDENTTNFKVYKEYLRLSDNKSTDLKLVKRFQSVILDYTGVIYFINKIQDIPSDIYFIIPNLLGFNQCIKNIKNNMTYFHKFTVVYKPVRNRNVTTYIMINKNDLNSKLLSELLHEIDNFMIMINDPDSSKMLSYYCDSEIDWYSKSMKNYYKMIKKLIATIKKDKKKNVFILSGYFREYNINDDLLNIFKMINLSQYYFKANGLYLKINNYYNIDSDIVKVDSFKSYINNCEKFKIRVEYPYF